MKASWHGIWGAGPGLGAPRWSRVRLILGIGLGLVRLATAQDFTTTPQTRSVTLSGPGTVLIQFSYRTGNTSSAGLDDADGAGKADFAVLDPQGQSLAAISLSSSAGADGISVAANGTGLSISTPSYQKTSGSPSNGDLSGGVSAPSGTAGFQYTRKTTGGGKVLATTNASLSYAGSYAFRAPVAGTYQITAVSRSYSQSEQSEIFPDDGTPGNNGQTVSFVSTGSTDLAVTGVVVSDSPAPPLGQLQVLKGGGAGGVNLRWSVTPPSD